MSHAAIILCGGQSARMGRDKASLPFGPNETMLGRVARLVAEVVPLTQIVCVAAPNQILPALPAGVITVHDTHPHRGPLAGLASGLTALANTADAALAIGCDVPLFVPAVGARLFELLDNYDIAAPHDGTRWHPLPAVYRTDLAPRIESLLTAGRSSLVALLESCNTRRIPADDLRDIDPQLASLTACNTPDDYRHALVRISVD